MYSPAVNDTRVVKKHCLSVSYLCLFGYYISLENSLTIRAIVL